MTAPVTGKQIGRSLPRLEARAKVSGRAEYTHIMRLPGMLTCKLFRSTVAHGRIKSIDVSAARALPGVFGVYTGEDIKTSHSRSLLRPRLPRPADPRAQQGALRRRAGRRRAGRRSARGRSGRAVDRCRIRGIAGGVRRGRGRRKQSDRARRTQARHHLRRSQASEGRQEHQLRARFQIAPRRRRQGLRLGRAGVRAHLQDAEGAASGLRAARLDRRLQGRRRHHHHRLAGALVRAHRDRAPARLAGKPRAHQGAVSGRRLWRQALHQAGGAGGGAVDAGAAAGEGRAHHGRGVLYHHQASRARSASRPASTTTARSSRANAMCGGTAAPMPISARG